MKDEIICNIDTIAKNKRKVDKEDQDWIKDNYTQNN